MIRLDHVTKRYRSLVAVDDLSLATAPGEVFGLLGPNAAGKTTLVGMAAGLLAPDAGSVEITGLGRPTDPRVRARIGIAPQSVALYDELTGTENLTLFGRLYGLRGSALRENVNRALAFTGLTERAGQRVRTYSGGMKRRLNIAAALVHRPAVVLLDEPTVGVDPQSRNAIFDHIRALRHEGCTVLLTTHYMEEAERLCDRVGVLDHGRLLAVDTVEALLRTYAPATPAGVEAVRDPAPAVRPAGTGDLEQVFFALTGHGLRD
jgi:ABC-2 type transport system ATP-binding protein